MFFKGVPSDSPSKYTKIHGFLGGSKWLFYELRLKLTKNEKANDFTVDSSLVYMRTEGKIFIFGFRKHYRRIDLLA